MAAISPEFARHFAEAWITAWNAHDLESILSHYTDDFEMSSPVIVSLQNEPSGTLYGKAAVKDYWAKALQRFPDLRFELLDVFTGVNSIVIYYRGPRGLGAEQFWLNAQGKVSRASAHYAD